MAKVLNPMIEGFDPKKVEEMDYDPNWKQVYASLQNQTVISGPVTGIATMDEKPCAVVMIGDVRGFIPLEESGTDQKRQLHRLVGKPIMFQVTKIDQDNQLFMASRTAAKNQMSAVTWRRIEEGQEIVAVVRNVTDNRVFADVGGIEVVIPISEIAYGWIDNLREKVHPGDHISVKVIKVDRENENIEVSAKAAQKNPWPDCAQHFEIRNEYMGRVTGVRNFGVFVNLEPGVDSLANHLKFEGVQKGDRVLVRILNINTEKEQIRTRITQVIS